MSEKLFAKMIFSLFNIIKQLFLHIMCKNKLIHINRLQEIMKIMQNAVIANSHTLCFSGQHRSELHMYYFYFFHFADKSRLSKDSQYQVETLRYYNYVSCHQ